MATVGVTGSGGRDALLVQCFEPMTKCFPAHPPYDREILESAVAACPGAAMRRVGYQHIPCPADFGDERFDYELEITHANVLALRAARFTWSAEAEASAAGLPVAGPEIAAARERADRHLLVRRREVIERDRETLIRPNRASPVPPEAEDPGEVDDEVAPPAEGFLRACVAAAARYLAVTTRIFWPFGIAMGILSWDWRTMLPTLALGAILGILMGIGEVAIDRIFEPRPTKPAKLLLDPDFGPPIPPWWRAMQPGRDTISGGDAKRRARRWKAGLFGATACMLLAGHLWVWAVLSSPIPPAPGSAARMLVLIGIVGAFGGIGGAVLESRCRMGESSARGMRV